MYRFPQAKPPPLLFLRHHASRLLSRSTEGQGPERGLPDLLGHPREVRPHLETTQLKESKPVCPADHGGQ